jgi:MoxR-like ATPase
VTATPLLPSPTAPEQAAAHVAAARRVVTNVEQVVHGRDRAVELVTCALLAGGHVLVEDVPGSGKTTLARAFSRSVGGVFQRVQATADLLPGDITGSGVWEADAGRFRFVPGPLFANVVLVDELNRTPARTQSAFLEAMEEHAVTVDGVRHALPDPFFLVATQNPLEQHGTFPLPEGQLDRFAISLTLGAIDHSTERQVVREQLVRATVDDLSPVLDPTGLIALRAATRGIHVADPVLDHAVAVVRATREDPRIRIGASSRAALALVRCAQGRALLQGRDYVLPDDTQALAVAVLGHRIRLADGPHDRSRVEQAVAAVVARVPVPVGG